MQVDDFVEWLESELGKRKLSRAEFSKRGKIAAPQVTRVLNREQNPGLKFLFATARALKLPRSIVYRAANIDDMDKNNADEWVEEMDHKLSLLDPKYRSIAERIIDSMLAEEEAESRPNAKIRPPPP